MAAVRAVDVVVGSQRERHADRARLLPDGKVGGARMVVCDSLIGPLDLDLVEDRFELADGAHVLPDAQQIRGRVLLEVRLVGIDWDV